tara:strand:+ start:69 stop:419 length:351 start_codon:yes stop_codon:yes gene_type:complete
LEIQFCWACSSFFSVDYRVRTARRLHEKQTALIEEAKTMYESLLAVEHHGAEAVQDLVDNVCARMNSKDSPGHHIAAQWNDRLFQARSHGHDSAEMFSGFSRHRCVEKHVSVAAAI